AAVVRGPDPAPVAIGYPVRIRVRLPDITVAWAVRPAAVPVEFVRAGGIALCVRQALSVANNVVAFLVTLFPLCPTRRLNAGVLELELRARALPRRNIVSTRHRGIQGSCDPLARVAALGGDVTADEANPCNTRGWFVFSPRNSRCCKGECREHQNQVSFSH